MYNLLTSNGGLYIKIGQAFANNAALLPRPMQEKFATLFDDAPQVPYATVERVFRAEFGRPPAGPDGVFAVFEEQAAASASIAQVHRAQLKSGEWVAVKVQKPDVSKQVEWDLGAFRAVMWIYEHWLFHLPVCFAVDFITDHLRRELDFEAEARNARRTAKFVGHEPRLADRVYIPRVYPELSTKKVMVAEWIDGVRLSDRRGIERLMGDDPPLPADRFPTLTGGSRWVMQTMVDLFSAQIFDWSWVHCDPHPGNIIVRPHPAKSGQAQFVLLDHSLYVRVSPRFQQQYARLWKGLLSADFGVVKAVTERDAHAAGAVSSLVVWRCGGSPKHARSPSRQASTSISSTKYDLTTFHGFLGAGGASRFDITDSVLRGLLCRVGYLCARTWSTGEVRCFTCYWCLQVPGTYRRLSASIPGHGRTRGAQELRPHEGGGRGGDGR